jgi:hypothetical protein
LPSSHHPQHTNEYFEPPLYKFRKRESQIPDPIALRNQLAVQEDKFVLRSNCNENPKSPQSLMVQTSLHRVLDKQVYIALKLSIQQQLPLLHEPGVKAYHSNLFMWILHLALHTKRDMRSSSPIDQKISSTDISPWPDRKSSFE